MVRHVRRFQGVPLPPGGQGEVEIALLASSAIAAGAKRLEPFVAMGRRIG
ncbi:hypothetical protein [Actinomadura sp. CNU-125]|nr:hypothetical protein [Actinomadura sp. CNU-125]